MKKVILGGYYGMMNYGDDMFSMVSSQGVKKYWPNMNPVIMGCQLKDSGGSFVVPQWFPDSIYGGTSALSKASRLLWLLTGTLGANKFVFCGGSIFSSQGSGILDIFHAINNKNNYFSAIGVSIGPFSSSKDEKKTRKVLEKFEYLSLRDEFSYDIAKSFALPAKIVLAGDLAGMMPKFYPKSKTNDNPVKVVGFSPCFLFEKTEKSIEYCDAFIKAVGCLDKNIEIHIVVLNLNDHPVIGDLSLSHYVKKNLDDIKISNEVLNYGDMSILSIWEKISSLDAYISVRLHGAISAYLNGIPFALFEYHMKCQEFLKEIGQQEQLRIPNGYEVDNIVEILEFLLLRPKDEISPKLSVDHYQARSVINFTSAPWCDAFY